MTRLEACDRLGGLLDVLTEWDHAIDELQAVADLIDVDGIATAVCILDARTRSAMRRIERALVA